MTRPLRSELPKLFGEIRNGNWKAEKDHMCFVDMPTLLKIHTGKARIYCNKAIRLPLRQALDNVVARGLAAEFKTFDGCFCIRNSRGSSRLSTHSWGMAVDVNAETNRMYTDGDMSHELAACFEDEGFVWGGRWKHKDAMHFQYVTEE